MLKTKKTVNRRDKASQVIDKVIDVMAEANNSNNNVTVVTTPITTIVPPVVTSVNRIEFKQYVVTRGGLRVSENVYRSATDPDALLEANHWKEIIKRWPDGTNVEIVELK